MRFIQTLWVTYILCWIAIRCFDEIILELIRSKVHDTTTKTKE